MPVRGLTEKKSENDSDRRLQSEIKPGILPAKLCKINIAPNLNGLCPEIGIAKKSAASFARR